MSDNWVHVEYDFNSPPQAVFDHLAEHENLGPLFGAKITRVRNGETDRNGVGSVRLLKVGPLPSFEETVTQFSPNELIEYRITQGSPLRNHVGIQRFTALPGGGTHVDYRIRIASSIPGLAPVVTRVLTSGIVKGFSGLDSKLA